jgi:hypothetical protein
MTWSLASPLANAQSTPLQPTAGVSYYALQGFSYEQCTKALHVFDGVAYPSLSIVWGTFGTDTACLRRYLSAFSEVPHILEVHITNNTCLRGRICRRGELVRGVSPGAYNRLLERSDSVTIRLLRSRISKIVHELASIRGPNTRLLLSTGLEDDYTSKAFEKVHELLSAAQQVTPFEIVRSPSRRRARSNTTADLLEMHGFSPRTTPQWQGRCIVNNDGDDIHFERSNTVGSLDQLPRFIDRYTEDGCLVFLWWSGPQGLFPALEARITPARRRYDIKASEIRLINQVIIATSSSAPMNP